MNVPLPHDAPPLLRNRVPVLLAVITLAGVLLRLCILPSVGLWYDEACTVFLSDYAADLGQLFNPDYNNDPPLFLIIIWLWRQFLEICPLLPGTYLYDYLLRLPPILFGILVVPATYFAGRSLFTGGSTASSGEVQANTVPGIDYALLFGTLLTAISPIQIYYAQELRSYSLFALMGALCLWCFSRACRDNRVSSWALLALCLVLAFWNHFFAVWFFLCIDVYLLLTWRTNRRLYRNWALWHVIAGIACLPPLYVAYHTSRVVSQITGQWIPAPGVKSLFITFKAFFAGYGPQAWAYWPIFLLATLLCCLGVWRLRTCRQPLLLLLLWSSLAMPVSMMLWSLRDFSYYEIRLFIWAAIPAAILAGLGWQALPRLLRAFSLLLILGLTAPLLIDTYAQRVHPLPQHRLGVRHKADTRGAANYVREHGTQGQPIFHASHVTLPSFRVYLPQNPQKHVCLGYEQLEGFIRAYPNLPLWQHLDMVPVPVTELDIQQTSFWLVISWWEPFERPPDILQLERWFYDHCNHTEMHDFYGITLIECHTAAHPQQEKPDGR